MLFSFRMPLESEDAIDGFYKHCRRPRLSECHHSAYGNLSLVCAGLVVY